MSPKQHALELIASAHRYTSQLLDQTNPADWFTMPAGNVSHIAWQVGHLAVAAGRLGVERIGGGRPGNEVVVPPPYRELFAKGSTPSPHAGEYPSPADIRAVYDAVHARIREEVAGLDDADLEQPPLGAAHPRFTTKLGSLVWCAQHEMLHAGQIGLLRRLLGAGPIW
jgi:hypothetical protein